MNKKLVTLFALTGLMLATFGVQAQSLIAGSADAGEAKALACTACHGSAGNSSIPTWPNIAGQNASYILAQLQAFKNGSRQDPLMSSQVMTLSDDDMANLAVYFESLPAAAQHCRARTRSIQRNSCMITPTALARRMAKPASCEISPQPSTKTILRHFLLTCRVSDKHETSTMDNHAGAHYVGLQQGRENHGA